MTALSIDYGEITTILGQKNTGKSVLIEHLLTKMPRAVVIDPMHDHFPPGFTRVSRPLEVLREWQRGNTRLIVRDPPLKEPKAMEYIRSVAQLEDAYLVIDESDTYMSEHACPDVLTDFAQYTVSHQNIGLLIACRQSKKVYTDVWTQTDNLIVLYYGGYMDSKISELGLSKSARRKIANLDPEEHRFFYWKAGREGGVFGPVPLPDHLN